MNRAGGDWDVRLPRCINRQLLLRTTSYPDPCVRDYGSTSLMSFWQTDELHVAKLLAVKPPIATGRLWLWPLLDAHQRPFLDENENSLSRTLPQKYQHTYREAWDQLAFLSMMMRIIAVDSGISLAICAEMLG